MTILIEEYDWQYLSKESIEDEIFLRELYSILESHEVFSVGEHHDENTDQSFVWILNHEAEILEAFDIYKRLQELPVEDRNPRLIEACFRHESVFLAKFQQALPSFTEMKKMHVGRLFAFCLMPLAKATGYNYLVLEGVDSNDPARLLELSKDRVGDLIRILMSIVLNFKVSGVVEKGIFKTPVDIGQGLLNAAIRIKEGDPSGKVLIYNGAMHNETQPFTGEISLPWGIRYDAKDISYAPRARALWGEQYQSINLLSRSRMLPQSHYSVMQGEAGDGITRFNHGINQKTYVI